MFTFSGATYDVTGPGTGATLTYSAATNFAAPDAVSQASGATTNYAYTFLPNIVTATTNSHWSKAYKDGFGRDTADEAGYGTTIVSHSDTVYAPCACSPL